MSTATEPLTGLVAVVTGAGSGIGLATARRLHARGVTVFGLDLHEGAMAEVATWVPCDVSDSSSVDRAMARVGEHTGVVDILVNNAGIGAIGSIETATEAEWLQVFSVNVFGIGRVTKAALPLLRASASASVVNTCSVAASVGLPQRAVYSASKGAVEALTRAMAADFLPDHIRVNCVNPGTADTPWVTRLLDQASDPDSERAALERRQPSGRLVTPEEVASAICFLASPDQGVITGTVLAVDGGMHALQVRVA